MKLTLVLFAAVILSFPSFAKNQIAPSFSLPSFKGNELNIEEWRGKVVYLDFWASWCKPCVESFPKLEALQQKYQGQGFTVIAINLDEKKQNALKFLAENPVSYPVLYDANAEVAQLYQVAAMPSSYFIDKKGIIRLNHRGFIPGDENKIEKAIQFLLKEN